MRKEPPTLSYETPEPPAPSPGPPLVAWYHIAVTAVLTFVAGAILIYFLAGAFFRS